MPTTLEALLLLAFAITPGYILLFLIRKINPALITNKDSFGSVVDAFIGSAFIVTIATAILLLSAVVFEPAGAPWPDRLHVLDGLGDGSILQSSRVLLEYVTLSFVIAPVLGW